MIESIFIATSGMLGHERGLTVISNNVSNMNTAGFRGSTVSFSDVFIGASTSGLRDPFAGQQALGGGVNAGRTQIDFRLGDRQATSRDLDMLLTSQGFFIVEDESGELRYTRDGSFEFNADEELVLVGQRTKVMTRNASGELVPITTRDLMRNPSKTTTTVNFEGTLSSQDSRGTFALETLDVFDSQGVEHTLKATFTRQTEGPTNGATARWNVVFSESGLDVGTATIEFILNDVMPGTSPQQVTLLLRGGEAMDVSFNFDEIDGGPLGNNSALTATQDGFAPGRVSSRRFDANGVLKITYSNGQTADGAKLALAQIEDLGGLVQMSDTLFAYQGGREVIVREAGDDLQVISGALERSNVSLTRQFSELILMQRGYQASSQVLSTANDLVQSLLDLRGRT
ncbi:MAG: flagellar hook-basal body complex protein [Steroidobacter sp.]